MISLARTIVRDQSIILNSNNIEQNRKFTIHYTTEELNKIQEDFLKQLSKYLSKVGRSTEQIR